MDIKEIALKVAEEQFPHLPEEVMDYAEALVAEIQRQSEPVARTCDADWVSTGEGTWLGRIESHLPLPELTGLFTFPPDKAQIEQSVAEACAAWCEDRMAKYEAGGFVREFSAARTTVNAIRSGEWKKFIPKGE